MPGEMGERPRLAPGVPLPPYRFVPGSKLPHPTGDPAGHSFGKRAAPDPSAAELQDWAVCVPYLHALDLFNHGYYWEAHEAWEALWQACGRHGPLADFLKALIKLAAAGVKVREGVLAGVRSHGSRAADLFERVAQSLEPGQRRFLGLDPAELARLGRALEAAPPTCSENEVIVFDQPLLPAKE